VGEVRARLAGPDDALVVAGLTLQCALHRGGSPEPGFLDRYARAWAGQHRSRPVWLAEAGDEHAGHLQAAVLRDTPWPGRPDGGRLLVETCFVRPTHRGIGVGEVLLDRAVRWARDEGLTQVVAAGGPHGSGLVERAGFTRCEHLFALDL
jgi:GNAT superfamily N-acetyltransferase